MNTPTRRTLLALAASTALVSAFAPSLLSAETAATDAAAAEPKDFSLGDPNAPVKVVEYASYTCPHCASFHANVFKDLKKNYIDTGKVHFTLREVYFDRYGLWAAMVARCGGEMKYFGIHDILFSTQKEWSGSDNPNDVVANLKKIALAAGMDGATVDACMQDQAAAEALVARFQKNMEADGVQGTPTFFINGTKHSNMAYADFAALIDAELAK